jgi:NAD+ kinase
MPLDFSTIGLIGKQSIEHDVRTLKSVVKTLEKYSKKILLDEKTARLLGRRTRLTRTDICAKSTLIVTLGGDGTLLKTARHARKNFPPILSINIGRLGFLTECTPQDLEKKLKLMCSGKYKIDARSMLSITVHKKAARTPQSPSATTSNQILALNDAVINQGAFARLIKMSVQIDNLKAASFKADGLIIATPTGSTGHSLSAGGPIIHPKVDGMVITPICPVLLSMRPIVIPDNRTIRIRIETARRSDSGGAQILPLGLTIDGQHTIHLDYEDEIIISRAPQVLNLIRATDRNYYKTLNEKLGWGYEKSS